MQFERFDAVADLLERAGKERPVVVLLDDLQWADSASLDLLEFLTTRLSGHVMVLTTVRTLAVGSTGAVTDALAAMARRPGSRRLRLRGLPADATGELLDAVAPGPVSPQLAGRIHERAEGNPFYAIELARLLDDGAAGEVPATVRDVIRRRLGQLPDDSVDVLTVAAVVGRDVDIPLVAAGRRARRRRLPRTARPRRRPPAAGGVTGPARCAALQPRPRAGGAARRPHAAAPGPAAPPGRRRHGRRRRR